MKPDRQKLRGTVWGIILILLLASCSTNPTRIPAPSPQAFRVALSPALEPMATALHQCALDQPEIALILNQTPLDSIDFKDNNMAIKLGANPEGIGYSAALAVEQIVIIVNPDNPVKSMNAEELGAIFSGQAKSWEEFGGNDQEIQVWAAPTGNAVRKQFDSVILGNESLSTWAFIAPDAQTMLSNVADNPDAIGYVPAAWLTDKVGSLNLDDAVDMALRQPVLALLPKEPTGPGRTFLFCLQSGAGQRLIQARYLPWK